MSQFAQARAKGDTRGQHYAAEKARRQTTEALAEHIYGKRSIRTKRLKALLEGK